MSVTDPDFIIIGAGAAGCTLAREIVTRGLGSVLMLESGSVPRASRLHVPSDYLKTFGSRWDWDHRTSPQKGLGQRVVRLPAGHALGGSTAINAMIWIEPDRENFELWHREGGHPWSLGAIDGAFANLRNWLEEFDLPSLPPLHPRMQRFLEQSAQCGWTASSYPSGFDRPRLGIDAYRRMQTRGRRVSLWNLLASDRQRWPIATQRQLRVISDTRAVRLLFDGDHAIGVRCISSTGDMVERRANRGVLLCAGAIETTRLMMASGLGPRDELQWSGIPCRVDLPELGKRLQDHPVFPIVYRLESETKESARSELDRQREARLQYLRDRSGPRSSNLAELGGFLELARTKDIASNLSVPQFQLHITPTHYLEPNPFGGRGEHVSFAVTPLQSGSQGSIALARAKGDWDGESLPPLTIDPNYLSKETDRKEYLNAIETVRDMISGSPRCEWLGQEVFPKWKDHDRMASYLQRFASTIYHYAGSCAMGSDKESCLDGSLQVRGVDGLWVCDASAMPLLVHCNPQASVAMMAVRLADMLGEVI